MAARIGYGIDFGTTNSVASAVSATDASAYPYLDTGFPHPSFVWYSADGVRVGREAKQNYNTFAENAGHRFIRSVKRELGQEKDYETLTGRVPAWRVASEIF